jgi:hypothetical protein
MRKGSERERCKPGAGKKKRIDSAVIDSLISMLSVSGRH